VPSLSHLSLADRPKGCETTSASDDHDHDHDCAAVSGRPLAVPAQGGGSGASHDPGLGPDDLASALAAPGRQGAGHVVLPATGLHMPRRISFEKWLEVGRQLSAVVTSSAWCLGDWLVYGETAFTGRYRDAVERTSLDYKTLRNYAWVARRFPLPRRREGLSFGHHAEVAGLPEPEQEYWLRKAEQLCWSRNKIRHEIRASRRERDGGVPEDDVSGEPDLPPLSSPDGSQAGPENLSIVIHVTPEQLRLYQQTASQRGHSVQTWAAQILDDAVHGGL
jgi:hypothetical protein